MDAQNAGVYIMANKMAEKSVEELGEAIERMEKLLRRVHDSIDTYFFLTWIVIVVIMLLVLWMLLR